MKFYEETMPISDSVQDYSIYFISESISEFEKINMIIKKGMPFQKEHLLSHMEFYIDNSTIFPSLLHFITGEIEMWDSSLQITFAQGLYKSIVFLLRHPLNAYSSNVILSSINWFQKAIATYEDKVSNEYSINFGDLMLFLSKKPVRLKLSNEIIQFANSLGKFGQDVKNRRLSVFLCCSLLKISNDFNDVLFKRIMMLSGDVDCIIKRQMAYELRELIKIVPYEHLKELIASTIDIPLNKNNNDMVSYSEALSAITDNMKVCLSIQYKLNYNFVLNAYKRIFNDDNDFDIIKKPFITLINCITGIITNEEAYPLIEPIRTFISLFYLNSTKHFEFFIEYFDQITCIFLNDTGFLNILLDHLYKSIPSFKYCIKQLFYSNIHRIVSKLPLEIVNCMLWENLLIKSNLPLIINDNFDLIISSFIKNKFYFVIKNILEEVDSIPLSSRKPHSIIIFLAGLKKTIQFVYDYGQYYPNLDDIYTKIIIISKELITGSRGFLIQSSAIRLIPLLLKYSKERYDLNTFIQTTINKSDSFYTRRLFAPFVNECIEVLSINYLIKLNIIDNLIESIQKEKVPSLRIKSIDVFSRIMRMLKNNKSFNHYISTMRDIKAIKTEDIETTKALLLLIKLKEQDEPIILESHLENEHRKQREEDKILEKDNPPPNINIYSKVISKKKINVSRTRVTNQLPPVIMSHSVNQTTSPRQIMDNISFNNNHHHLKTLSSKSNTSGFYKTKTCTSNVWNPIFHNQINNQPLKIPAIKLIHSQKIKPTKPFKYSTSKQLKKLSTNISFSSFNK